MHVSSLLLLGAAAVPSVMGVAVSNPVQSTPQPTPSNTLQPPEGQESKHPPNAPIHEHEHEHEPTLCGPHGPGALGTDYKLYANDPKVHITHLETWFGGVPGFASALVGVQVTFSNGETEQIGITTPDSRSCELDSPIVRAGVESIAGVITRVSILKEDQTECSLGYRGGVQGTCAAEQVGEGVLVGLEGRSGPGVSSLGFAFV